MRELLRSRKGSASILFFGLVFLLLLLVFLTIEMGSTYENYDYCMDVLLSSETWYTAVKAHGIHIHSLEMERLMSLPSSVLYSAILKFRKQTAKESPSGLGRNSTCSSIMVSLR